MGARWERQELKKSRDRGVWDRWGVGDSRVSDGWLLTSVDERRIYAPLEHKELPHAFAKLADKPIGVMTFVEAYGRLGWRELQGAAAASNDGWIERTRDRYRALIDSGHTDALNAEPIDWILAHARTVQWCLAAGHALALQGARRDRACTALADTLPRPAGLADRISSTPLTRESTRQEVHIAQFVAQMASDYLTTNLRGVRRRVEFAEGRLRTFWGGRVLLDSIYTLVADGVTRGTLKQCEAPDCGAVFIQTDARERYCPPREGLSKSTCMNRMRVRKQRNRSKEKGRGKKTRAR